MDADYPKYGVKFARRNTVKFENGGNKGVRKTYILATDPPATVMGYPSHAETAKGGGEWSFRSIHCGHCVMVAEPGRTAELILESAAC